MCLDLFCVFVGFKLLDWFLMWLVCVIGFLCDFGFACFDCLVLCILCVLLIVGGVCCLLCVLFDCLLFMFVWFLRVCCAGLICVF